MTKSLIIKSFYINIIDYKSADYTSQPESTLTGISLTHINVHGITKKFDSPVFPITLRP